MQENRLNSLKKNLRSCVTRKRVEREAAREKAAEERDSDLLALMAKVEAFNKKYGENMRLIDSLFPFL